jgi:hypothetical protein
VAHHPASWREKKSILYRNCSIIPNFVLTLHHTYPSFTIPILSTKLNKKNWTNTPFRVASMGSINLYCTGIGYFNLHTVGLWLEFNSTVNGLIL